MKIYEVDKKEFFKEYSLKDLIIFRKRLNLIEGELKADNLEMALSLTMDKPYIDTPEFNFYRINILIRLGHPELALDVAENEKFKDFKPIQVQKDGLIEAINARREQEEDSKIIEEKQQEQLIFNEEIKQEQEKLKNEIKQEQESLEQLGVTNVQKESDAKVNTSNNDLGRSNVLSDKRMLITKLYVGILTLDEIEASNLKAIDKAILTICYYDKYNHKKGLEYIKSIKKIITDEKNRKILNNLQTRLESRRNNFFDVNYYRNYLGNISFDYAAKLERKIEEKLRIEEEKQRKEEEEQAKAEEARMKLKEEHIKVLSPVEEEIQQTSEYQEPVEETSEESVQVLCYPEEKRVIKSKKRKKDKKVRNTIETTEPHIIRVRDAFPDETVIIGAYVYAEANRLKTVDSIKALDIFEDIINKDINTKYALSTFENIVYKFSKDKRIGVTYHGKRFGKYLRKRRVNI